MATSALSAVERGVIAGGSIAAFFGAIVHEVAERVEVPGGATISTGSLGMGLGGLIVAVTPMLSRIFTDWMADRKSSREAAAVEREKIREAELIEREKIRQSEAEEREAEREIRRQEHALKLKLLEADQAELRLRIAELTASKAEADAALSRAKAEADAEIGEVRETIVKVRQRIHDLADSISALPLENKADAIAINSQIDALKAKVKRLLSTVNANAESIVKIAESTGIEVVEVRPLPPNITDSDAEVIPIS